MLVYSRQLPYSNAALCHAEIGDKIEGKLSTVGAVHNWNDMFGFCEESRCDPEVEDHEKTYIRKTCSFAVHRPGSRPPVAAAFASPRQGLSRGLRRLTLSRQSISLGAGLTNAASKIVEELCKNNGADLSPAV